MQGCSKSWTVDRQTITCRFATLAPQLSALQQQGLIDATVAIPADLPLDSNGFCPFHSPDREWQASLRPLELHRSIVSGWDEAIRKDKVADKFLNFRECIFGGHAFPDIDDEDRYVNFSDLKLTESATFQFCRFLHTTWFANAKMSRTIIFENCEFEGDVDFGYSKFGLRFTFNNCSVAGNLTFRETEFSIDGDFKGLIAKSAAFNDVTFHSYFDLEDAKIGRLFLIKCRFLRDINSAPTVLTGLQANFFSADQCEFFSETRFDRIRLKDGEIIDCMFPPDKSVSLDGLQLSGILHVKSRSPEEKLFHHAVSVQIAQPEDVSGRLLFENVNAFHLRFNEVAQALRQMRPPRVVLGAGCDPYRLKKIPIVSMEVLPLKIEWTNPIVIAAIITATAAAVAALVQTFKKTGERRSQQQTVTRSSGTTQIAAGRDVHIEDSKKDQRVDNSQN